MKVTQRCVQSKSLQAFRSHEPAHQRDVRADIAVGPTDLFTLQPTTEQIRFGRHQRRDGLDPPYVVVRRDIQVSAGSAGQSDWTWPAERACRRNVGVGLPLVG